MVGLICNNDETAYRDEVQKLSSWCSENNLTLNVLKTKELIMDFRRIRQDHTPLLINGEQVETVTTFRFLGTHIAADHSWTHNTGMLVKKAQQRLYFLRVLKKNNLHTKLLLAFYHSSIESVLTYCLGVWYAGSTAKDRKAVQRVINTAQKIIGCPLPAWKKTPHPAVSGESWPSQETLHTRPTLCLICCLRGDATGQQNHTQTD